MLTPKEFDQLIDILPRLEGFVRNHQLSSLSIIKIPFDRKPADLYLCYTQSSEVHGFDKMALIGQDFKELWGVPIDRDIVLAQEKDFFDSDLYEKHLKGSEFFLVSMDVNQNYITATATQVVDYAKRDFDITVQSPIIADNSKQRRISDEKIGANEAPSRISNNFFTQVPSQNSESNIDDQIEKLSLDECKQHLRNITRQFGVNNLIQIRPARK